MGERNGPEVVSVRLVADDVRLLAVEAERRRERWDAKTRRASGPHRLTCAANARQWHRIAVALGAVVAPRRAQGAQDGRGALEVVWGVVVVAVVIWGAQEAARLGGWMRVGVALLTVAGAVVALALEAHHHEPTHDDYERWRRRPFRGG